YDLSNEDALIFEINGQEAFPAMDDELSLPNGNKAFSLLSNVRTRLENPEHPAVQAVIETLVPDELGASLQQRQAIARAVKNAASRLLDLNIIVAEKDFRNFLSEVAAKVLERKGINAIERYFATALDERLLAALDRFSQESKQLDRAAETNPKAAAKLEHATEFLRAFRSEERSATMVT
ncbi:MAG: hypothetical protein WB586_03835, partial [Chthoniobacterales bacterium]